MNPKRLLFFVSTGTTFTIGVPRFVTTTGSPVVWISFMIVKQRALNALAPIRLIVFF